MILKSKSNINVCHLLPIFLVLLSPSCAEVAKFKSYAQSPNYRLYQYLMKRYKKDVRPIFDEAEGTSVGVYTYIQQLVNVEQLQNTITVSGYFELFWRDEFLKWEPKFFNGTAEIFFPAKQVWTPEISAYYSVQPNRMIRIENDLRVNYTGDVRCFMPFTVKNLCHFDVKYFPFDKQKCFLMFGPWAYPTWYFQIKIMNNESDTTDFYDNQEWLLENTSIEVLTLHYDYLGHKMNYSAMTINLYIYRQSFYYVFNLVIPTAIIAYVSIIGFHMPATSSQTRDAKFRLGIMTILSMTMLLLAVVDNMPKFAMNSTSTRRGSFSAVPLIGIYYFSLLTIIGLGTVTSSMFVELERKVRRKQVPWFLKWMAWQPKKGGYQLTKPTEDEAGGIFVNDPANDQYDYAINRYGDSASVASIPIPVLRRDFGVGIRSTRSTTMMPHGDSIDHFNIGGSATMHTPAHPISMAQQAYDSSVLDILQQLVRELIHSMLNIEKSVIGIRCELYAFMPKNTIADHWLRIINRLETTSLVIYLSAVTFVLILFFFHDWY